MRKALLGVILALAGAGVATSEAAADSAAPETTQYKVCGPLGCLRHATEGTITWGTLTAGGNLKGTSFDKGPGSTVVRFTIAANDVVARVVEQKVDERSISYVIPTGQADKVTIQVCSASMSRAASCVTKNFPPTIGVLR